MVEQQLRNRDVEDERVLDAMEQVPRHVFVPEGLRDRAYDDAALPIGSGQTISQPYMVARICEALSLHGSERVLDVGTGSGYQAAVLATATGCTSTSATAPWDFPSMRRSTQSLRPPRRRSFRRASTSSSSPEDGWSCPSASATASSSS